MLQRVLVGMVRMNTGVTKRKPISIHQCIISIFARVCQLNYESILFRALSAELFWLFKNRGASPGFKNTTRGS